MILIGFAEIMNYLGELRCFFQAIFAFVFTDEYSLPYL